MASNTPKNSSPAYEQWKKADYVKFSVIYSKLKLSIGLV